MPKQITLYNVMIGSPSDLKAERKIVIETIHTWNHQEGNNRGIHFEPYGYERDSAPLIGGEDAQAVINHQIGASSELLIAMFWTKLGTPTPRSKSGTLEEVEQHLKTKKPILLYISQRKISPQEMDSKQLNKLSQFKKKIEKEHLGLYREFKSKPDLEKQLLQGLQILVDEYDFFKGNDTSSKESSGKPVIKDIIVEETAETNSVEVQDHLLSRLLSLPESTLDKLYEMEERYYLVPSDPYVLLDPKARETRALVSREYIKKKENSRGSFTVGLDVEHPRFYFVINKEAADCISQHRHEIEAKLGIVSE